MFFFGEGGFFGTISAIAKALFALEGEREAEI
jgi:hypothetical protein